MITTNNETFDFVLYKRVKNSPYEYEPNPTATFKGRPANTLEKKNYRIQKGINGNTDSHFILSSNLPSIVDIGDQVAYLGKIWTIMSIGYYFDNSRILNNGIFNPTQVMDRCPKGINIQ